MYHLVIYTTPVYQVQANSFFFLIQLKQKNHLIVHLGVATGTAAFVAVAAYYRCIDVISWDQSQKYAHTQTSIGVFFWCAFVTLLSFFGFNSSDMNRKLALYFHYTRQQFQMNKQTIPEIILFRMLVIFIHNFIPFFLSIYFNSNCTEKHHTHTQRDISFALNDTNTFVTFVRLKTKKNRALERKRAKNIAVVVHLKALCIQFFTRKHIVDLLVCPCILSIDLCVFFISFFLKWLTDCCLWFNITNTNNGTCVCEIFELILSLYYHTV